MKPTVPTSGVGTKAVLWVPAGCLRYETNLLLGLAFVLAGASYAVPVTPISTAGVLTGWSVQSI
jgi:hypothetical protein